MALTDSQQRNIATIRTALANAFTGGFDVLAPLIHEDFVIYEAEGLPFGGVFRGMAGYIECMAGINAFFSNNSLTPPDYVPVGEDRVLMLSAINANIAANGQRVEMPTIAVWDFKDGKVAVVRPFFFDTKRIADLAAL